MALPAGNQAAYQWPNVDAPLNPNRICLRGRGWQKDEFPAGNALILPGMLLAEQADGTVIPHPTAGGLCEFLFALEDTLQGKTIQQLYALGDMVQTAIGADGDIFYLVLASGATAFTKGQGATSDGAGGVKLASGSNSVVGVFLDTTASPTAQTWTRVRIFH